MRVVILVPRRDDGGWRDRLWAFCRAWWEEHHDPMPIYEGYHAADEGPFNRSQAVNRASALADEDGRWDVAVIIDSDTISNRDAVRTCIQVAAETNALAIAHDERYMMNKKGTEKILRGDRGNWKNRGWVERVWKDSVSCAVIVSREMWDAVEGFDERFVGWGFEDTAFMIAVETISCRPVHVERADCFHLWHPLSPEATRKSPTYERNHILKRQYEASRWDPGRLLWTMGRDTEVDDVPIPKILHRTVPEKTSDQVEEWWRRFAEIHPGWDLRTYREPIDPVDWPMTGDLFHLCQNGAQKAGLIRLEALYTHGGVYVDSDVEPYRPLDALLNCRGFAAWEDETCVPDAVLGCIPRHPAWFEMIGWARASIEKGEDAWKSGPGVTTRILPSRADVVVLPPGAFYPAHYHEKAKLGSSAGRPWVFLEHKWHHSWGSPAQHAANAAHQVIEAPELSSDLKVAICMPWRDSGDQWRRAAHDWCSSWWRSAGFTICLGEGRTRTEMCNRAVTAALDWGADVMVIVDADTWTSIEQVKAAIARAVQTGRMTHAYTRYGMLPSSSTQRLQRRRGLDIATAARGVQLKLHHVSGIQAITADLWREVGGFDERFVGWGFEDQAFDLACGTIGRGVERIDGIALHWYHKSDPTKTRSVDPSDPRVSLMERYVAAAGRVPEGGRVARLVGTGIIRPPRSTSPDTKVMRSLLAEPGGPLASRETHLSGL